MYIYIYISFQEFLRICIYKNIYIISSRVAKREFGLVYSVVYN